MEEENKPEEVKPEATLQPQSLPTPPDLGPKLTIPYIKSLSLAYLTRDEINRSVYCGNISINATLKQIYEFFCFCGTVSKFFVYLNEKKTKQFAVVVFQNENSFSTSLLLSNAVIVDEPIKVVEFRNVVLKGPGKKKEVEKVVPTRVRMTEKKDVKDGFSDFIASSFAKSEELLAKVKGSIKRVDQDYKITERVKKLGEDVKSNVKKVDENIKFSQTVKGVGTGIKTGVNIGVMKTQSELKKMDEKYKITEKTKKTVSDIDTKLKFTENTKKLGEGIKKSGEKLSKGIKELGEKEGMKKVKGQVEAVLLEFKMFGDDTKKKYEEKRSSIAIEKPPVPVQSTGDIKFEDPVQPTVDEVLYPKIDEKKVDNLVIPPVSTEQEVDLPPEIVLGNETKPEEPEEPEEVKKEEEKMNVTVPETEKEKETKKPENDIIKFQ